jgi:hypothetical protein
MNQKMTYNRTLSYYEKLGFDNLFSWREKDLSQFLIFDYLDTFQAMGWNNIKNLLMEKIKIAVQKYDKYRFAIELADRIYNDLFIKLLFKSNKKNEKILFKDKKCFSIISEVKKYYPIDIIVTEKKDRLFAFKNFLEYINMADLYLFIYRYLVEKNGKYLNELIKKTKEKIQKINPNYIILSNDILPIERAIVAVSKNLRICTLAIQHGLYQSNSILPDGRVADYILVWGEYFRDLYVKSGFSKPEEIYILGYPYLIEKKKVNHTENKHYIAYYLGGDFENFKKDFLSIKLETIKNIYKICNDLNIKFIYRPHPGDDRQMLKSKLPEVSFTSENEEITETFNKGDIFIAYNSTSLVEAAMRSKVCLQLINYPQPINTDNFEKLGICSKSFRKIKELAEYLEKLVKSPDLSEFKSKFNKNYIEISYNPNKRFLEILDDIKNNEKITKNGWNY